jgi:hypothetical protein
MNGEYVATTKNGKEVYVNLETSHAATHIISTPHLLHLVKEVLENTNVDKDNLYFDKDLGRDVGTSDLVETTDADNIVYAKRLNRDNYTRFTHNRKARPTSFVTVVLQPNETEGYNLMSAWTGRAVPQFPGDEYETPESKPFWRTHALVWGNQAMQPGTERHDWPWG